LRRVRQIVRHALELEPDAVILIDSGDFNYRVARGLKRAAFPAPIIKYVSPQVWASRPGRVVKIARVFDHVMTLLPFEPPYYERVRLPATFVGHPVTERVHLRGQGKAFRALHGFRDDAPVVAVLPGSRVSEIVFHLPIFAETVARLRRALPDLRVVVPTVRHIAGEVRKAVDTWPGHSVVIEGDAARYAAFEASNAALAASGTVSLELAQAGVPTVVAYRVGWLTGAIALRLMTVRHISLVNLVLGREAVPEFVQDRCRAELLAPAVLTLLTDGEARDRQTEALQEAVAALRVEGETPSARTAATVLEVMRAAQSAVAKRLAAATETSTGPNR